MQQVGLSNGPIAPGTVIDDKFRIEQILGEGAMGVVVRALHLKLGTPVALKFLLPRLLGDRVVVERFAREARAAARLTSDHVARVLDVGNVASGAPYMVMEYLSGETLGAALKRRGSLPVAEACGYMIQVCDALTEAHGLGIIHRDLKPANFFLATRPNGKTVLKVLDFGISKMGSLGGDELTMASSILGTPLYMAPEQISSSRTVDGRADLWSCGVCLHRMLAGDVPFDASSIVVLGAKLLNETAPRLDAIRADVPSALADIVLRCLEHDITRRWQSAAELASALERFALGFSTSGSSPTIAAPVSDDQTVALIRASGPSYVESSVISERGITASESAITVASETAPVSITDLTLASEGSAPNVPARTGGLGMQRPSWPGGSREPLPRPASTQAQANAAPPEGTEPAQNPLGGSSSAPVLPQAGAAPTAPATTIEEPTTRVMAAVNRKAVSTGQNPALIPHRHSMPSSPQHPPSALPPEKESMTQHPYFGVGLGVAIAIVIATTVFVLRPSGCLPGPPATSTTQGP